MKIMKCKIMSQ